jgi:hypothetical protein
LSIDIPTFVMQGDDEQIVPFGDAGLARVTNIPVIGLWFPCSAKIIPC